MDECSPVHFRFLGLCSDGDPDPPTETTEGDATQTVASTVVGTADGEHNGVEDGREWRREQKAQRRARLKEQVDRIIREIRMPIRDIVGEHVLPRLPVQSLLRFRSVSAVWRTRISAPIFCHVQSQAHRSASGVFRQQLRHAVAYSPFDPLAGGVPDPSLSFLPSSHGVAVLASSNGLLCCAGVIHSYYVCNPSTAGWTSLPEPPPPLLAYHDGAPVVDDGRAFMALVFEPSAANLEAHYHVVRAYEVCKDVEGVYGFQVFSSGTGEWRLSSEVCAAEKLVHGSGVSAGGLVYWRTTMQTVVAYDPVADRCRCVPWPMGYTTTALWQLGEMGGRLCCTCVADSAVEVYALAKGDRWSLLASYRIEEGEESGVSPPVFRGRPWPLRFQSGEAEALLWVDGTVVGLDVAGGLVRVVCVAPEEPWMNPFADYVPHISSFAPVFRRAHHSSFDRQVASLI